MLRKLPVVGDRAAAAWHDVLAIGRRTLIPAGAALRKMGAVGGRFADDMSVTLDKAQQLASEDVAVVKKLLNPLTQPERNHIGRVLGGEDVAKDVHVQGIVDEIRLRLDRVAEQATEVQLRELMPGNRAIRPFQYRDDYFPIVYPERMRRELARVGSEKHRQALRALVARGQAKDLKEAARLLDRHLKTPVEVRDRHLQLARTLALPGWDEDPTRVLPQYFMRAWKRIETARTFGANDEHAAKAITLLRAEGHDAKLARDIYFAFADRAPRDYGQLVRATRTFNIVTLLSTAGLLQPAQLSNTIAVVGYRNFVKGLAGLFTTGGRKWAARTGAYMQELMQELHPFSEDIGGHFSLSRFWVNMIGLEKGDKANRIVSALAGYHHAGDMAQKLVRNPTHKATLRELVKLGLDPEQVLKQGGQLTSQQLRDAGQALSHRTQFRGSVLDLPILKQTPVGQFMFLFKTFALQQMTFVEGLMKEFALGNRAPLFRYLAATGTLGAGVGTAARAVRGRKAPDDPVLGYLEAAATAGALGMAYDAFRATEGGQGFMLSFLAGPTVGQLSDFISEDVPALARGDSKRMMRSALKKTPGVGPVLTNWLIPKED
jgi:hypothetical protein